MTGKDISARADFGLIRYAQLWEDADVLTEAIGPAPGKTLVSIASAGDNALALLTLDPAQVIAMDLSAPQLACLRFRIAAMRVLDHRDFLVLMGARQGPDRGRILDAVLAGLDADDRAFWAARRADVLAHGAGGVGKFERYFRLFRRYCLPLVHRRRTIRDIFAPGRDRAARAAFLDQRFDTWRWRLLLNLFFSRFVMGRMGRDAAFFDHVDGSPAAHVARRIRHAAVDLDPAENPYLHWIMTGTHGTALPLPWRHEAYEVIRTRLDRITAHQGPIDQLPAGTRVDGYNLSDIFEYMDPALSSAVYGRLLDTARPGARLVYWNMMAPRRVPEIHAARVTRLGALEDRLKARDKAFFYSDFVVEEVR